MWSYRYMPMSMTQLLSGNSELSSSDLFSSTSYMAAPSSMTMDMHMVGAMVAPTNKLTLMGMVPYHINSMTSVKKMGNTTQTVESQGIGDVKASAIYGLVNRLHRQLLVSIGVSAPTGDIDVADSNMVLGYGMQLGSGTFDVSPAVTFRQYLGDFSFGAQVSGTRRLGDNVEGYRLGHIVQGTSWVSWLFRPELSASLRFGASQRGAISGTHQGIMNAMMNPTMDASNYKKQRQLVTGFGLNYLFTKGALQNLRLGVEYQLPTISSNQGVQLVSSDPQWVMGIQKSY